MHPLPIFFFGAFVELRESYTGSDGEIVGTAWTLPLLSPSSVTHRIPFAFSSPPLFSSSILRICLPTTVPCMVSAPPSCSHARPAFPPFPISFLCCPSFFHFLSSALLCRGFTISIFLAGAGFARSWTALGVFLFASTLSRLLFRWTRQLEVCASSISLLLRTS